ncbi:hypothetical protein BGZ67_009341 [Mortierella alpina]|nr:hypothetical protein BGZ67_009341 [Mortierella alpina]
MDALSTPSSSSSSSSSTSTVADHKSTPQPYVWRSMADSNARYRLKILAGPGSDPKLLRPLNVNDDPEPMIIDTDEFHGYVTFRIKDLDKAHGYTEGQLEDGIKPVPNSKWFDLSAAGTKSKNLAMNLIHASPLALQDQDAQTKTAEEEKFVPPWTSPNGEHVLENTRLLFEALEDPPTAAAHPQKTSSTAPAPAPAAQDSAARSSTQRQHFFAKPKNLIRHRYQPDQMYDFEFTSAGPYLDFANFKLKVAGFSIDLLRFWDGQPGTMSVRTADSSVTFFTLVMEPVPVKDA